MADALKPSEYNEITIISADDPSRSVDIRLGVVSLRYYESILAPSISISMVVVDSGESIIDKTTGKPTTIYQGLPLRGGEKVRIDVKANSPSNINLQFVNKPLIVRSIKNASIEAKRQSFVLDLVPESTLLNEVSLVTNTYRSRPIDQMVREICNQYLNLNESELIVDSASNPISYDCGQKKPFTIINELAKRAVSTVPGSMNDSAGFFFFQTREALSFIAIDTLCSQNPATTYFYNEVNINEADFEPSPSQPSLDRKIIKYEIIKNQDLIGNLKTGAYATERRYFNPIDFTITNPKNGYFSPSLNGFKTQIPTLGSEPIGSDIFSAVNLDGNNTVNSPNGSEETIKKIFSRKSRILTETYSFGTYNQKVSKELDEDIFQTQAQALARYNTIFGQCLEVLVPLSTKLSAGDVVQLNIPETGIDHSSEYDQELSGNYLIKDICHSYNADGSYTSMKVVRDTYGNKFNQ